MRSLVTILLICLACFGCSRSASEKEPLMPAGAMLLSDSGGIDSAWSIENTLVIHATAEPDNLHPTNGNSALRNEILQLSQVFLLSNRYGTLLEPVLLKELPTSSSDRRTFSCELKKGLKWPDGSAITCEDVVFTCKVNASGLADNPTALPYWNNLQAIHTVSSTEFVLTLEKQVINDMAFLSSFPILQRTYYDPKNQLSTYDLLSSRAIAKQAINDTAITDWFKDFNSSYTGTGIAKLQCPGKYTVSQWSTGTFIILEKREKDSEGPQKIVYRFNRDENTVLIGFHDQLYDVSSSMSASAFRQALKDPALQSNYRLVLSPTYNYSYICFNTKPEQSGRPIFFKDALTRKAFASIVPIDDIIKLIYGDFSKLVPRMSSYVSPLKSDCDSTLHPAEYDFAKGGKLLAKAGWTDKNQNGLLDCREGNGTFTEFEPELLYLNASPDWQSIAELITASAAKVGIRIKAVAVDPVTFSTRAKNHDFDILLGSWGGNALPEDPTQLWGTESWNSNGSNYSGFGNSRTDSLIATVVQSPTDNQRRSASIELQKSIQDEQPYVFLYNAMRRMIIHKRWTDVLVFPDRPGYLPDTWRLRCQPAK